MTTHLELLRERLARSNRLRDRAEQANDPQLSRVLSRAAGARPVGAAAGGEAGAAVASDGEPPPALEDVAAASAQGQPAPAIEDRSADAAERRPAPAVAEGTHGTVRILSRRQPTPDLLMLRLERPRGFEFRPGQHVKLELASMSRKYSLASAPSEPFLEVFVERQPAGKFTPHLFALPQGARVGLRPKASGSLQLADAAHHVMVATVTGISPFVSMIRAALRRPGPDGSRFHVLHGASYMDELGYAEELDAAPSDRVVYVPTVSRPSGPRNAGWAGATGRVDAHLEPLLAERGLSADETVIYACGHPDMVRSVATRMRERGFRVRTEAYD